ncbi:MAG: class I SAM-dependent methyltransferase [Candidatus Woesearchaeota archaeon]
MESVYSLRSAKLSGDAIRKKIFKKEYHSKRLGSAILQYRLRRRIEEIERAILNNCHNTNKLICLDVGASDGLMLSKLRKRLSFKESIGVDIAKDLIVLNKDKQINLHYGDIEKKLAYPNESFDIIYLAGTLEYLEEPERALFECQRLLKRNGLIIITTPNPLYVKLGKLIKYDFTCGHNINFFSIAKLKDMLSSSNFQVVQARYFMLNPFFCLPFESIIEKGLVMLGLGRIMTNQIVVARKK